MSEQDIRDIKRVIEEARQEMKDWPLWKQNILTHSGDPESTPRQPIRNDATAAEAGCEKSASAATESE